MALVCPKCAGNIKQDKSGSIVCSRCGEIYLVEGNIPVLLVNAEESLACTKKSVELNPAWYEADQISSMDGGPYRHHYRKRLIYLSQILNKYNFASSRILDIGCGDGANLRYLVDIPGATVFGIDNNLLRLQRAQKNSNEQAFLVLADILKTNFIADCFDIVLCNHVLEHIEKDFEVLVNINRLLKPGGLLILGTPNEGAWMWQLDYKIIEPWILKTIDHVHFYTAKSLSELVQRAGFKIEEIKYMGWGLPHTVIDALLRQYKWIDDLFEIIGKRICKSQATSLYFICKKEIRLV